MTKAVTKIMWTEIKDDRAENINGGSWKNFYLGSVGALQVNGGNGVQNNYYIFNIFLGGRRR